MAACVVIVRGFDATQKEKYERAVCIKSPLYNHHGLNENIERLKKKSG
jgi:hypothetical protein